MFALLVFNNNEWNQAPQAQDPVTCQSGAIYRRTVVTKWNRRELVKCSQPLNLLFLVAIYHWQRCE